MTAARGAPQVTPSARPDKISGASASFRGVDQLPVPGARRVRKACNSSRSILSPAGRPSTTTPMPGAWDWPKMETVMAP